MSTNKKASLAIKEVLSRQNYLVTQGNDLAKAFGGLTSFEQRVLDYCFSFVTKDSKASDTYKTTALNIIKHFGLNTSGDSYKRISTAFKRLNENTALYLPTVDSDGVRGILMTQLFSGIGFKEDGIIQFEFSKKAAPLIFDLKTNYYSFRLGELSRITGKYSLILLKLWESYRHGKEATTTITGDLEQWESWFLSKEEHWPAGRFHRDVLERSIKELEGKLPIDTVTTTFKRGRTVVGYEIQITDTSNINA
ncbi:replication initiation protein [Lactiplantibacillus plantarum]|uniref:replication initiation protein n=1 Tax=Lactiplantibacillus plantarum TaxID=1590 RepID=UPI0007B55829|nr:replication initiation protein [Lactiplantibacillus plantarum]KZU21370.1 hypothetical protein Nizo2484_1446 [Lactiplantibacillus plantarum]KZU27667.1 hypothetical protein Nizo2485_1159 [Lactiplantibacillus plantarum]